MQMYAKGLPVHCLGWKFILTQEILGTNNRLVIWIESQNFIQISTTSTPKKKTILEKFRTFFQILPGWSQTDLWESSGNCWNRLEWLGVSLTNWFGFKQQVTKMAAYGAKRLVVGVVLCVFGGFGGCFIWSFFVFLSIVEWLIWRWFRIGPGVFLSTKEDDEWRP